MLVPIFFACDEKFVKFTMVAIRSIIANASAENTYKIHILHMGISEPTQKKATDMATENVDIEFVDVTENMNKSGRSCQSVTTTQLQPTTDFLYRRCTQSTGRLSISTAILLL